MISTVEPPRTASDTSQQQWLDRLSGNALPAVTGIVQALEEALRGQGSVQRVTEIIQRDAGLSAQVIKVAGNVRYRASGSEPQPSISRAVAKIGLSGIRAVVVSLMVVDSLLKAQPRERLLQAITRALHGATQARAIAESIQSPLAEEAFAAALLSRLGELAFWAWGGPSSTEAVEAYLTEHADSSINEAVQTVLGISLDELSRGLAARWSLGDTALEAVSGRATDNGAAIAARQGEALSRAVEQGWNSPAMQEVIVAVAGFTGRSPEAVRDTALEAAREAEGLATGMGVRLGARFAPASLSDSTPREPISPDPERQLALLRDLSDMLSRRASINDILLCVLEGIHVGVGMERVALLIVNPERTKVQAKNVLGAPVDRWRSMMQLSIETPMANPFAYCLQERRPIWVKPRGEHRALAGEAFQRLLGQGDALLAPVYAGSRSLGVLFADRDGCGAITPAQYQSFCHFSQQANMALSVLAGK